MFDCKQPSAPRTWARHSVLKTLATVVLSWPAALPATEPQPWEARHAELVHQSELLYVRLSDIHDGLVERARSENPELLERISLVPPAPRETGYGLLPEIGEDGPAAPVKPKKTVYSLRWVQAQLTDQAAEAGRLRRELASQSELEGAVGTFERLLETYRKIEDHLGYHVYWQQSIRQFPVFFENRNRLLPVAGELAQLAASGENPVRAEQLREEILAVVAPFHATAGLLLVHGADGDVSLPVAVCTDIEEKYFLERFKDGVERAFLQPVPGTDGQLSVELSWRLISPEKLYEGSPPRRGDAIDMENHRARFSDCPLVLLTGGADTFAFVGDRIVLGTRKTTPRGMAHEFGHLLGFSDAYLRGYEGQPDDPYGVVLIEWTGLTDDLMGSSGAGEVSPAMIETLIAAYSPGQ